MTAIGERERDTVLFVPMVAQELGLSPSDFIALDKQGVVELRPESSSGLLKPAEAALCPMGPGGIPLSWLRLR